MFDDRTLKQVREGMAQWWDRVKRSADNARDDKRYSTVSDLPIKHIYTPEDIKDLDYETHIGYPGSYPYTRGCQPDMYRGRVWTFRMFSGFGSAEDTNKRYHKLMDEGETGLSVAFDFPTLMGYDSDSPRSHAEIGKCGVAIDTLFDYGTLFVTALLLTRAIQHLLSSASGTRSPLSFPSSYTP